MITSDYQRFERSGGSIQPTGARLQTKLVRIPLPDLQGKTMLDVGCHSGFWCYLAAERGAAKIVGIDQNPIDSPIAGQPFNFRLMQLGKTWHEFGRFDVVLMLSVYHHLYQAAGGAHEPIWFWLWRHVNHDGVLIAEVAVTAQDHTVQSHVSGEYHAEYSGWMAVAERYFHVENVGPAVHEPLRRVYRMKPKISEAVTSTAKVESGYGMASVLMEHEHERRKNEIERLLGMRPFSGTLNLRASGFDWEHGYYRGQILALKDRSQGTQSSFAPRWMRFYPLVVGGFNAAKAYAARFENEYHSPQCVELIAPHSLRDALQVKTGDKVMLCR